jgi:hypothetical protein
MLPLLIGASDLSSVHTGSEAKQLPVQFVPGLPDLRVNRPSVDLTIRPLPVTSLTLWRWSFFFLKFLHTLFF